MYKEFIVNNVDDYHDLYAQSDTLLLAGVSENVRNNFFIIYVLDNTHSQRYQNKTN